MKKGCFQYHICSCVVNSCAEVIFNQRERNFATELGQGTFLMTLYVFKIYYADLYRWIRIKFCFEAFPRQQFNLPCELLMCVTCWSKLYHFLSMGSRVENRTWRATNYNCGIRSNNYLSTYRAIQENRLACFHQWWKCRLKHQSIILLTLNGIIQQ
jgi:hypothetical protein